jgi:hypothetical protein
MTEETTSVGKSRRFVIAAWIIAVVGALAVMLYLTLGQKSPLGPDKNAKESANPIESPLAVARTALGQRSDIDTCRDALGHLNTFLTKSGEGVIPPLGDQQAASLQKRFGLAEDEMAEIKSASFTPLDAQYLDACFLLRDAARIVDPKNEDEAAAPLERASAAFAWAVRQVRLDGRARWHTPPAYALRRGWGSALDRALVFLALLDQMGRDGGPGHLQGSLVLVPD